METKFTPGSWYVRAGRRAFTVAAPPTRLAGGGVARISIAADSGRAPEGLANAHLISAAPDLYEALKDALLSFEAFDPFPREKIIAALKKARGEQ